MLKRKIDLYLNEWKNQKDKLPLIIKGARNREYVGVVEWLTNAGIINQCYCMDAVELPHKRNYNPDNYKLYFMETGLLVASLDDEVSEDLMLSRNYRT